ncbi:hypothetical protein [Cupriavidus basilensis]
MTTWPPVHGCAAFPQAPWRVASRDMYARVSAGPVDASLATLDGSVVDQAGRQLRLQDMLQGGVTALQTCWRGPALPQADEFVRIWNVWLRLDGSRDGLIKNSR